MWSNPRDAPEPDPPQRAALVLPWRFVLAGVLFLVVLAPLVPDEPMHLSGVMVVLGLVSAALAVLSGTASAIRSETSERRSRSLAAVCGLLIVLGWLAWWVMKLMSQVS